MISKGILIDFLQQMRISFRLVQIHLRIIEMNLKHILRQPIKL